MPKFSIFSWFGFPIPMEERFKLIKAAGFDGVLLWWADDHIDEDGNKELQPELARRIGLFIENIHTPYDSANSLWTDSSDGDAYEKVLMNCIADCAKYEIPTAVLHASRGSILPPPNYLGLDRIKRLVEFAERKNVNIAIENIRHPELLDYIFPSIHSSRLGFCYDSGHENCYTHGTDLLRKYGSRLMALHLHDNDGTDDYHQLPGDGTIHWDTLMKKLDAAGYTGAIALEVQNRVSLRSAPPEVFLNSAFNAAKQLVNK